MLLAVLVISYRQVIEAFPAAAARTRWPSAHLGLKASLVAAGPRSSSITS